MLDPRHLAPDEFTRILDKVPWLARLGSPESADDSVIQISGWEEWPGPEDPGMELLSSQLQNWKEQLMAFAAWDARGGDKFWHEIERIVTDNASRQVDYKPEEDPWYGPTAAVWSTAFVAALVGCSLRLGSALPLELVRVWGWYARGHWPFGYEKGAWPDDPGRLMVL